MSLKLIVRPEAEADILNAALWYENREVGVGLDLTDEIHAAIDRALDNPLAYPLLRKHPPVRRVLARRFPYRIFYIVRADAIVVFCSPACCAERTALAGTVVRRVADNDHAPLFTPVRRHQIIRSVKSLYQQIILPVAAFQGELSGSNRTIFRVESFVWPARHVNGHSANVLQLVT